MTKITQSEFESKFKTFFPKLNIYEIYKNKIILEHNDCWSSEFKICFLELNKIFAFFNLQKYEELKIIQNIREFGENDFGIQTKIEVLLYYSFEEEI